MLLHDLNQSAFHQSKLLLQQLWNSVTKCHYQVPCKQYDSLQVRQHEIKKHSQAKLILAFTIDSVSSCFLTHYIYTTHMIVVKLDDIRTRNRCFVSWTFFCLIWLDVSRIPSTFLSRRRTGLLWYYLQQIMFLELWKSLSFLTFSYLHSISASAFELTVPFLWRKFHPQKVYWAMLGC